MSRAATVLVAALLMIPAASAVVPGDLVEVPAIPDIDCDSPCPWENLPCIDGGSDCAGIVCEPSCPWDRPKPCVDTDTCEQLIKSICNHYPNMQRCVDDLVICHPNCPWDEPTPCVETSTCEDVIKIVCRHYPNVDACLSDIPCYDDTLDCVRPIPCVETTTCDDVIKMVCPHYPNVDACLSDIPCYDDTLGCVPEIPCVDTSTCEDVIKMVCPDYPDVDACLSVIPCYDDALGCVPPIPCIETNDCDDVFKTINDLYEAVYYFACKNNPVVKCVENTADMVVDIVIDIACQGETDVAQCVDDHMPKLPCYPDVQPCEKLVDDLVDQVPCQPQPTTCVPEPCGPVPEACDPVELPCHEKREADEVDDGCPYGEQRILFETTDMTVTPETPLPPEDVEGKETPDWHGTDPIDLGPQGYEAGTVTVRDDSATGQPRVCVDFTPAGGSAFNVACVNRAALGPADALVPRGDTPVLVTDPVVVPGTPGQEVPDVEDVPEGSVGTAPRTSLDLTASYWHDPDQVTWLASAADDRAQVWAPFPPTPAGAAWFLDRGDRSALELEFAFYVDGQERGSETVIIPYLGQVIAAMQESVAAATE